MYINGKEVKKALQELWWDALDDNRDAWFTAYPDSEGMEPEFSIESIMLEKGYKTTFKNNGNTIHKEPFKDEEWNKVFENGEVQAIHIYYNGYNIETKNFMIIYSFNHREIRVEDLW